MSARFLIERGARVCAGNVRVGDDEIDLLVRFDQTLVAVEVKSRLAEDPIHEFTAQQAAHLRRAAGLLGAHRCDLVTVRADRVGVAIRWLAGVC